MEYDKDQLDKLNGFINDALAVKDQTDIGKLTMHLSKVALMGVERGHMGTALQAAESLAALDRLLSAARDISNAYMRNEPIPVELWSELEAASEVKPI